MANLHISISAEPLFDIGGFTVTNSIFTTWLVSLFLITLAFYVNRVFKNVSYDDKPGAFQGAIEFIIEMFYDLVHGVGETAKKTKAFFPLVTTFFLFIAFSNWSGLLPGVGTIGYQHEIKAEALPEPGDPLEIPESPAVEVTDLTGAENETAEDEEGHGEAKTAFVPYFRAPTADLNTTFALALFSIASVQIIGVKFLGIHYPQKFINLKSPIGFAVGILEIFSEISRIISFAFRLFGNIFAGEVLLAVIAFLVPLLAPLPFLGLEVFVGFIQALVFAMLTLVFLKIATIHH